jgi:hypothetical protein
LSKQKKDRDNKEVLGPEVVVGYSWLPLMHKGRLRIEQQGLPVSAHLPPGYLSFEPLGLGRGVRHHYKSYFLFNLIINSAYLNLLVCRTWNSVGWWSKTHFSSSSWTCVYSNGPRSTFAQFLSPYGQAQWNSFNCFSVPYSSRAGCSQTSRGNLLFGIHTCLKHKSMSRQFLESIIPISSAGMVRFGTDCGLNWLSYWLIQNRSGRNCNQIKIFLAQSNSLCFTSKNMHFVINLTRS